MFLCGTRAARNGDKGLRLQDLDVMLGTQLPDTVILPWRLLTDSSARATAGSPGQVGAKIPARSGYFVTP